MKRFLPVCLILTILLGGCNAAQSREIVFVPDISQSIDAAAEEKMFAVIEEVAQHLRRGDTLTIIPITGNAQAELQGRTLHYAVPSSDDRQAYDLDLRTLNQKIKDDLASLQNAALTHPGRHTDIIGSVEVAMKAFSDGQNDKRLFVLSDFIQDDDRLNFLKDPRLRSETDAVALAEGTTLSEPDGPKVQVVLGRLRSKEFSALDPSRQRAINAFWEQVMTPATIDPDGTAAVLSRRYPK